MIERNVHHQGKTPSRTCSASPEYSKVTGKWSACFETWRGIPGDEYLVTRASSGSFFDSEDNALAAADRALDTLQATGKYPNMCEPF